ncbi:MAG: aldose 1-epimerase family protein [Ruminococcaceae bacterium]|nr:aldose 1-epimerase family protein [Oscillospiraceae bacterium]
MTYVLKNDQLTVTLSSFGAEMISVKCTGDCEYIWQGDKKYWASQAPIPFPVCGRFYQGKYTYGGKEYSMGNHGFARHSEFEVASADEKSVSFVLKQSEQTLAEYPFDFEFTVTYTLDGPKIDCNYLIKNTGKEILPATVGAHPGFNVPLDNGNFDDWYLEFSEECSPDKLVHSNSGFNTGLKRALYLEDSKKLALKHSLFDIDSIFMSNMAKAVTLKSDRSSRYIRLEYADMSYLGVWHKPQSDAPYVCIEPWCGLPSFDGKIDDLATKSDMFRIPAGSSKTVRYSITFG